MAKRRGLTFTLRLAAVATTALLALAAAALAQAPQSQPPGAVPAPEATGTAKLAVQVVAADNGAPVKRVRLMLTGGTPIRIQSGVAGAVPGTRAAPARDAAGTIVQGSGLPPGMVRKESETDEGGRCDFADLPAGRYSLGVSPQTGFVRPERLETVQLVDGQAGRLTIRLERTGAITGRVLDETGEPVVRAQVRALRRQSVGGATQLLPAGTMGSFATTNDLGQFRLFDPPPGDYYVAGTYTPVMRSPVQPQSRAGYAPTYYPGQADVSAARSVSVRSGQDTPGVEFALLPTRLGRVTGLARDSAGSPFPTRFATVTLRPRGEDQGSMFSSGTMMLKDGSFVISDVPPGEYYLVATLRRGEGPEAQQEGSYVPVTVNGDDVTMNIQTNTGATVSGRIVVEGSTPQSAANLVATNAPRFTVSVRPEADSPSMSSSPRPVVAGDDGAFQLTGVRGFVVLVASGGPAVLKAIMRAGQDVTGKAMEFKGTERSDDVTIVMTTDTARLEGAVTDSGGQPATNMAVLLFPDDPERWFPGSPFVHQIRTLPSNFPVQIPGTGSATPSAATRPALVPGGFVFARVLPGRHLIVAMDAGNSMLPTDRESLERLRAQATAVTLEAGRTATVQLRPVK